MAVFRITDGNLDITMSDSIWCMRTAATPVGWVDSNGTPPGEFEDTFFRDGNWVWVKVSQDVAIPGHQDAFLHLLAGIEGVDYQADEIIQPPNNFTPVDLWSTASWDEQFALGKVCRIPWFDGATTQPACQISIVANSPGPGASKWYLFRWERHLVPPTTACTTRRIALMAFVDDSISTAVDFSVAGNEGFAQRNCSIV